jgi:hypothetical protein
LKIQANLLAGTLLGNEEKSYDQGVQLLKELNFTLSADRYSGLYAKRDMKALDDASADVDAYLHPIVNTYRFDEAFEMLKRCGMDWASINSLSLGGDIKLIDLSHASSPGVSMFCLRNKELFESEYARDLYEKLENKEKMKIIELGMKPKGYSIISGKQDAIASLDKRIKGSLVNLDS